jgi:hypothetical protein
MNKIRILDLTKDTNAIGSALGKSIYKNLIAWVQQHKDQRILQFDLTGIENIDSSFIRDSILAVAKNYRCKKGFLVIGNTTDLSKWSYAARVAEQPILVFESKNNSYHWIDGSLLKFKDKDILDFVQQNEAATPREVSSKFNISLDMSNLLLKHLYEKGFLLRNFVNSPQSKYAYKYTSIQT